MWLEFNSQAIAAASIAKIDLNMGFPVRPEYVTRTWATPQKNAAGGYAFVSPDADKISGVSGQTEVTKPTWPADPGMK